MMVTPRLITASAPATAREPKSGRRASVPALLPTERDWADHTAEWVLRARRRALE